MVEEEKSSNGGNEDLLSHIGNSPFLRVGEGELRVRKKSKVEGVKKIKFSDRKCFALTLKMTTFSKEKGSDS